MDRRFCLIVSNLVWIEGFVWLSVIKQNFLSIQGYWQSNKTFYPYKVTDNQTKPSIHTRLLTIKQNLLSIQGYWQSNKTFYPYKVTDNQTKPSIHTRLLTIKQSLLSIQGYWQSSKTFYPYKVTDISNLVWIDCTVNFDRIYCIYVFKLFSIVGKPPLIAIRFSLSGNVSESTMGYRRWSFSCA
jgi:hypothetical protein